MRKFIKSKYTAFKQLSKELRITIYGVLIALALGVWGIAWDIYTHFNIDVELTALVAMNNTTINQTKAVYRVIFINSGNRPMAIQSVWAKQKNSSGASENNKPDVMTSDIVKAGDMLIRDIAHDLATSNQRGEFVSNLRFVTVDVNGVTYDVNFDFQTLSVGTHVSQDDNLVFKTYNVDLVNNEVLNIIENKVITSHNTKTQ